MGLREHGSKRTWLLHRFQLKISEKSAVRRSRVALGRLEISACHKTIPDLNMAFGTELLYFAGYETKHRPRPLVCDQYVQKALVGIKTAMPELGIEMPAWKTRTVTGDHYMQYLEIAEAWSKDPAWMGSPEAVEYALFPTTERRSETYKPGGLNLPPLL